MPQLVKGGKYIFGWSKVGKEGKIKIPPEAYEEYNLKKDKYVESDCGRAPFCASRFLFFSISFDRSFNKATFPFLIRISTTVS